MQKKNLTSLYRDHDEKLSDKWSLYIEEYDRLFDTSRDKAVSILEIGVQNGGSLDIWCKYFPHAQKIIGCDIDERCAELKYADPKVSVVCGDANNMDIFKQICQLCSGFDIIIDDGSHVSGDIIGCFVRYFDLVKDGGLYIVEDLHCSYWQAYGGGLYNPFSSMAFFKRLVDILNYEHWGVTKAKADPLRGIFAKYGIEPDGSLFSKIHSIEFVNSMCVIRKAAEAANSLGERVIAGRLATVNVKPIEQAGMFRSLADESNNFWSTCPAPPDEMILDLQEEVALQREKARGQEAAIAQYQTEIAQYEAETARREAEFAAQKIEAAGVIEDLEQQLSIARHAHQDAARALDEIRSSTTWRMTSHLRDVLSRYPRLARFGRRSAKLLWWTIRGQLMAQLRARKPASAGEHGVHLTPCPFRVIPHYISPTEAQRDPPASCTHRIAVHLHLYYFDLLDEFIARLNNIPFEFDLFVSTRDCTPDHLEQIELALREGIAHLKLLVIKSVPNRGRDLAPFIIDFGKCLLEYDLIGHFHTKKSPHNPALDSWRDDILDLLLGPVGNSGGHMAHVFSMLETNAKLICSEVSPEIPLEPTGWAGNHELARGALSKYFNLAIDDFPTVKFPEGSMIWARAAALRKFLSMPVSYDDFPPEPLPSDGTLAHALERLFFILALDVEGDFVRLHKRDSIPDYSHFEEPQDFSGRITHPDVKVLCYYLPQFHPIPENDRWHGVGFTEWTKVRAANPLFVGHYQQHIPHQDVGYYLLDDPKVLHRQAADMKRSGVYGQIFYHYWFSGKLILEQPARMLLDNTDIDMPFCFCWANENWTRRWDGSEHEILLKQDYSRTDARAFIKYLIPFFKDKRYIRVDGRPVLFIYRPSIIPVMDDYIATWTEECEAAGLPRPYVVATLVGGVTDPRALGLDAGAERVLYDWTAGKVPPITADVDSYAPIRGHVFSYKQLKAYYSDQDWKPDFTCFRSLVPNWDNTARYGADAHVVHGSTPQLFQEWLEILISQAEKDLEADRRFILVNAWNEWAEGTHLEADTRYGYAYLNAIGRALSDEPDSALIRRIRKWPLSNRLLTDHERGRVFMIDYADERGGAHAYRKKTIVALEKEGWNVILLTYSAGKCDWVLTLRYLGEQYQVPLAEISEISELVSLLRIDKVIVNNFAFCSQVDHVLKELSALKKKHGFYLEYKLHDFFSICPSFFLLDNKLRYCGGGVLISKCLRCSKRNKNFIIQNRNIPAWRAMWAPFLALCDEVTAFSQSSLDILQNVYSLSGKASVIEHEFLGKFPIAYIPPSREKPLVIGFFGVFVPEKGSNYVLELADILQREGKDAKIVVFGPAPHIVKHPKLEFTGRYNRADIPALCNRYGVKAVVFPSPCPETFSYVTQECMMLGIPFVCFDIGAPAERIRKYNYSQGVIVDDFSGKGLREGLTQLLERGE